MSLSAFSGRRNGITMCKRRAGSGNFNKHTEWCGQWVFPATSSFSYIWEINGGRWCLSNSQGQKNKLEMLLVLRMHLQGLFDLDNSSKMQHLQGSIIIQISLTFLFWSIFTVVITNFIYFISYNCMRNEQFE